MLRAMAKYLEKHHRVWIFDQAVQDAVKPLHKQGTEFEFPETLALTQSAEFMPFEDFGMFHDDRDTEVGCHAHDRVTQTAGAAVSPPRCCLTRSFRCPHRCTPATPPH